MDEYTVFYPVLDHLILIVAMFVVKYLSYPSHLLIALLTAYNSELYAYHMYDIFVELLTMEDSEQ